jgi:hypothetical protein
MKPLARDDLHQTCRISLSLKFLHLKHRKRLRKIILSLNYPDIARSCGAPVEALP